MDADSDGGMYYTVNLYIDTGSVSTVCNTKPIGCTIPYRFHYNNGCAWLSVFVHTHDGYHRMFFRIIILQTATSRDSYGLQKREACSNLAAV